MESMESLQEIVTCASERTNWTSGGLARATSGRFGSSMGLTASERKTTTSTKRTLGLLFSERFSRQVNVGDSADTNECLRCEGRAVKDK